MNSLDAVQSFTANIKCQTPGFEGFWDRHTLNAKDSAQARVWSDYLIINNYCNDPDVPISDRLTFQFNHHVLPDDNLAYQIVTLDEAGDAMQLVVSREFGTLYFAPVGPASRPKLWYVLFDGELKAPGAPGRFRNMTLEPVHAGIPFTYLGLREAGGWLTPKSRTDVGKYWYCYMDADGRYKDPQWVNDLFVRTLLPR